MLDLTFLFLRQLPVSYDKCLPFLQIGQQRDGLEMVVLQAMAGVGPCPKHILRDGKGLRHHQRQSPNHAMGSSYSMVERTSLPPHSVSLAEASSFCVQPRSENIK